MGTVYAGVHPVIGKRVAIKVLKPSLSGDPRMVNRFVQEARAVVKIQHRHIIDVFAFGHLDEVGHYFVMPLLDGESLGGRVAKGGPLAPAQAVPIVAQIADALDSAHAEGIYHRDLKPDNVFLARERDGSDSVRVLDFGIAKLIDGEVSTTQTGAQMGTPLFMSPEQWDGAAVDHRTDIYALGVLVHHVLTGRYPFESKSPVALMNMHANQDPMPASRYGADPAVDPVIARALAKRRDDRFASAGAFARALAEAVGGTDARARADAAPSVAPPPPSVPPAAMTASSEWTSPPSSRGRWLGAVLAVAVIAGVAIVVAATRGGDERPAAVAEDAASAVTAPADAGLAAADASSIAPAVVIADAAPARKRPPRRPPRVDARPQRAAAPPDARPPAPKPDARTPDKPKDGDKTQWGDTVKPF